MAKRLSAATGTPNHEKRIVRALRQLTQKLDAHSRHLLTGCGVTISQVLCLDELNEKGTMTVSALAGVIHLSPSTTVGIIDRLEKKGLIRRVRDVVDRRSVFVEITGKGREFIAKTPHLLHNKLHANLSTLSAPLKTRIAESLDLMLQLMGEKPGTE